jgi:hypothetical protein
MGNARRDIADRYQIDLPAIMAIDAEEVHIVSVVPQG